MCKKLADLIDVNDSNEAVALIKSGQYDPDNTLLISAINNASCYNSILLALIEDGKIDVGYVNADKNTALMFACAFGNEEIALALLATGKSKPNNYGCLNITALYYACKKKLYRVIYVLVTGKLKLDEIDVYKLYSNIQFIEFVDNLNRSYRQIWREFTENEIIAKFQDILNV